jgi:hypothetical protein
MSENEQRNIASITNVDPDTACRLGREISHRFKNQRVRTRRMHSATLSFILMHEIEKAFY